MPETAPSYFRPGAVDRIFGHTLAFFVSIGLIRGHFYVLEVRGRKSTLIFIDNLNGGGWGL